MSVADRLGLQDLEGELVCAARAAWSGWAATNPALAAVPNFADLQDWALAARAEDANAVLGVLASLTETDGDAVTALVWALLPGAEARARKLRDLHTDIDGLFAGQLWIEAARAHLLAGTTVAIAILENTRREVLAELGVGDLARRRDRAWADVRRAGTTPLPDDVPAPEAEPAVDVMDLLRDASVDEVLVSFDAHLLSELAQAAHRLAAPEHRGRMGLTSPAVVESIAHARRLAPRTLRRRATKALDRLMEYALAREDPDALKAWKLDHPVIPLTPREELELLAHEDEWWTIMVEEKVSPEEAQERTWRPPGRAPRA